MSFVCYGGKRTNFPPLFQMATGEKQAREDFDAETAKEFPTQRCPRILKFLLMIRIFLFFRWNIEKECLNLGKLK